MKPYAFGVDIGGTTVKIGFFSSNGKFVEHWEIPTRKEDNGSMILPDIASAIAKKIDEYNVTLDDIEGVGVGVPGPVLGDGVVSMCVNLGWGRVDVREELTSLLGGVPVEVGNDANVAALGEQWNGGGKGHDNVVMVTLGTGVGGGIILGGKIVAGSNGAAGEIPGLWWGCLPEQLETEQVSHSGGTVYGYGDPNAYMVFNEDGECISYKADGTQIAKGSYSLNNYDPDCTDGYHYGTLVTTDAPILFPFIINTGGTRANEFDVVYVDPNNLSLVCANGQGAWSWGECTWWRFKNASDPDAALAGSGERAWTYYPMNGSTWGNAGYIGDAGHGANLAAGEVPGLWWGCEPEQLETEQIAHSGGVAYGYGSSDAYMVFNSVDGTVTSYDESGNQIATSPYAVENFDWTAPGGYKMGDLTTAGGSGILFPFVINTGGTVATNYEIVYMDGNLLTLICANGQAAWSWGECTWWRFQPKR